MASNNSFSFKTSPIAFVKRLLILELFTASLTFGYRYFHLLNPLNYGVDNPSPFPSPDTFLTLTIIFGFQVIAITLIFFSWYLESYRLTKNTLTFSRTDIFKKTLITDVDTITSTHIEQGTLASTCNYGTLVIYTQDLGEIRLHNLSNPRLLIKNLRQFLEPIHSSPTLITTQPLAKLLKKPEGQHIEFKSSLQWDYHQNRANKTLHKAVTKNIAAFLNSHGGTLLLGVDDKGHLLGLEPDFKTLTKKNIDGFENTLTMAIKKTLGIDALRYLQVFFDTHQNKTVAKIICQPSPKPIFLKFEDTEEFYIRTGNSSQPLSLSQTVSYIEEHFNS